MEELIIDVPELMDILVKSVFYGFTVSLFVYFLGLGFSYLQKLLMAGFK